MTRVAGIDCGTNSIRLLIADVENSPDGGVILSDVTRLMEVVRLGQGVDRTGEFAPEALVRTLAATERYADLCREHGVEAVRFVATSATRDARNRDAFIHGVTERLGVQPEVISGTEEAALSFAGAVRVLSGQDPAPALVVDIGGGSTELVLGEPGAGAPEAAISLAMGCVRMTERHLASDPPTEAEVAAARADIRAVLAEAAATVPLARVGLVGVAGSVTTVTAHALHLDRYRPEQIDGARLPVEEILQACADLLQMSRSDRAALPYMHPGRVDVIGAGALVWSEVVRHVAESAAIGSAITSEHDILDGIALSVAARLAR